MKNYKICFATSENIQCLFCNNIIEVFNCDNCNITYKIRKINQNHKVIVAVNNKNLSFNFYFLSKKPLVGEYRKENHEPIIEETMFSHLDFIEISKNIHLM